MNFKVNNNNNSQQCHKIKDNKSNFNLINKILEIKVNDIKIKKM